MRRLWTPSEDAILRDGREAGKEWTAISRELVGRSPESCAKRGNTLGLIPPHAANTIAYAIKRRARVAHIDGPPRKRD